MTPVKRPKEVDENFVKEKEAGFAEFIQRKGLKTTRQRNTIISVFFRLRGHISVEELENMAQETYKTSLEELSATDASIFIRSLQQAA